MINEDEDALICDFAETYQVLDYRSLPAVLAATLAFGLRDDSRIKMKLRGETLTSDIVFAALQLDALNTLAWMQSHDGAKGRNRPSSIYKALVNAGKPSEIQAFDSGEELLREIERIRRA